MCVFRLWRPFGLILSAGLFGCAETLPDEYADYRERCVRMNLERLPARTDDPHMGEKDVFACDVPLELLESNARPFPDGAVIIKESTRRDAAFPWLVATAVKEGGVWRWNEYSRNFAGEEFLHILPSEEVCIDCHKKVEAVDWIYTRYAEE